MTPLPWGHGVLTTGSPEKSSLSLFLFTYLPSKNVSPVWTVIVFYLYYCIVQNVYLITVNGQRSKSLKTQNGETPCTFKIIATTIFLQSKQYKKLFKNAKNIKNDWTQSFQFL